MKVLEHQTMIIQLDTSIEADKQLLESAKERMTSAKIHLEELKEEYALQAGLVEIGKLVPNKTFLTLLEDIEDGIDYRNREE